MRLALSPHLRGNRLFADVAKPSNTAAMAGVRPVLFLYYQARARGLALASRGMLKSKVDPPPSLLSRLR